LEKPLFGKSKSIISLKHKTKQKNSINPFLSKIEEFGPKKMA